MSENVQENKFLQLAWALATGASQTAAAERAGVATRPFRATGYATRREARYETRFSTWISTRFSTRLATRFAARLATRFATFSTLFHIVF